MAAPPRRPGGLGARLLRQLGHGVVSVAEAVETALTRKPEPGEARSRLPDALRDIRVGHIPEAASILADLVPRSLQTGQVVAGQLPALLRYEDPQLLSLYHAVVVAVVSQDREAGPLIARTLPEHLAKVDAADRRRFMARVLRGAYLDWNLALTLCEHLPTLLSTLNDESLDVFLRRGFTLWRENSEKAMSYFRLESRLGQNEIDSLRRSLPLSTVRRTLQLYAQAHGGTRLRVRSIEELPAHLRPTGRSSAFTDGRNIYLPEEARGFATPEENFRLYKAMTAIEAGRIEFGTFDFHDPSGAAGEEDGTGGLQASIDALPHAEVAKDLFGLLETYRIEQRIRREYPGLVPDLERLTGEGLINRPMAAELEPLPAVMELFAQRLWGADLRTELIPPRLEPIVRRLLELASGLAVPEATVESSLERTRQALTVLSVLLGGERPPEVPPKPQQGEKEGGGKPREQEGQNSGEASAPGTSAAQEEGGRRSQRTRPEYRPFEPLPHQGRVWLDGAQDRQEHFEEQEGEAGGEGDEEPLEAGPSAPAPTTTPERPGEGATGARTAHEGEPPEAARSSIDPLDRDAHLGDMAKEPAKGSGVQEGTRIWTYPEWDWQIDDYKDNWCHILEERLPEGDPAFAEQTLAHHGPIVHRLKRQFQKLRREEFEKLRRQPDGDELDIDAVTEAIVELKAGRPPSERLYIQRQKRIRDVAVAFLLDMSSSTQQVVQASGKTILDIEKESLLLMAEALEALGDSYAIYGFSGYGRHKVSYYVAKEFSEPYSPLIRQRIGGMGGRLENRDGAAIRHTVRKLLAWPARVRLLILLSDGRPLDCGCRQYFERYAQEDTRMALREARRSRVHPFCITVDRQAQRYLSRMYGQVQYTIIDQVTALPYRLPHIYRRLTT